LVLEYTAKVAQKSCLVFVRYLLNKLYIKEASMTLQDSMTLVTLGVWKRK